MKSKRKGLFFKLEPFSGASHRVANHSSGMMEEEQVNQPREDAGAKFLSNLLESTKNQDLQRLPAQDQGMAIEIDTQTQNFGDSKEFLKIIYTNFQKLKEEYEKARPGDEIRVIDLFNVSLEF